MKKLLALTLKEISLMKKLLALTLMAVSMQAAADRFNYDGVDSNTLGLLNQYKCTTCHAMSTESIGPSLQDIADRYRDKKTYKYHGYTPKHIWSVEMPLVTGLVKKISQGGSGDWANKSMPQMDERGRNKADITAIVKGILAIKPLPEENEEVGHSGASAPAATASASSAEMERMNREIQVLKELLRQQSASQNQPRINVWSGSNAR